MWLGVLLLLAALRSLGLALGDSRAGLGVLRVTITVTFFLQRRLLAEKGRVRECCHGRVNVRCS